MYSFDSQSIFLQSRSTLGRYRWGGGIACDQAIGWVGWEVTPCNSSNKFWKDRTLTDNETERLSKILIYEFRRWNMGKGCNVSYWLDSDVFLCLFPAMDGEGHDIPGWRTVIRARRMRILFDSTDWRVFKYPSVEVNQVGCIGKPTKDLTECSFQED